MIEHLDELTDAARRCGSVNCVTAHGERLVGDNTEGPALVELVRQQVNPVGRSGRWSSARAGLLGQSRWRWPRPGVPRSSWPVGIRAAAKQLAGAGRSNSAATASHVRLDRALRSRSNRKRRSGERHVAGHGRSRAKLPIDVDSFGPKLVVADVAYNTSRTWLTQQAAERGCRIIDGLSLYVQQTALALRSLDRRDARHGRDARSGGGVSWDLSASSIRRSLTTEDTEREDER